MKHGGGKGGDEVFRRAEKMKADRTKSRVTFYYLLAETTGTLGKLG